MYIQYSLLHLTKSFVIWIFWIILICEVDSSGADNLGGTSANRVTDVNADTVGLASGVESRAIDVKNLPEHEHDLRSPKGAQFYVILDDSGTPQDADTIIYDAPTGNHAGQARTSSGGLLNRRNIQYNRKQD